MKYLIIRYSLIANVFPYIGMKKTKTHRLHFSMMPKRTVISAVTESQTGF